MAEDPVVFDAGSKAAGVSAKRADSIDFHLGNRVRFRRMSLNLSQEKLGADMGVTFQQIQKYEKGTNRISASRLYWIAQALSVPVSYFFEGLVTPMNGQIPGFAEEQSEDFMSEFLSSREGIELNRAFLKIKEPRQRRKLIDLVLSMTDAEPADPDKIS